MKKKLSIFSALFAVIFMLGLGVGYNSDPVAKKSIIELKQSNSTFHNLSLFETAYAEEAAPKVKAEMPKLPGVDEDPSKDLDTGVFLKALIKSIGSFAGGTALMIAALATQLLLLLFRTQLATFAGKWRLLIVYVLSLVSGVLALKVSVDGMEWLAALLHSNTLAAAQVLVHQVKKQFWDKSAE